MLSIIAFWGFAIQYIVPTGIYQATFWLLPFQLYQHYYLHSLMIYKNRRLLWACSIEPKIKVRKRAPTKKYQSPATVSIAKHNITSNYREHITTDSSEANPEFTKGNSIFRISPSSRTPVHVLLIGLIFITIFAKHHYYGTPGSCIERPSHGHADSHIVISLNQHQVYQFFHRTRHKPQRQPTSLPPMQPTDQPTGPPSSFPASQPLGQSTDKPTMQPTSPPLSPPADQPTGLLLSSPLQPTAQPTDQPSLQSTSLLSSQLSDQPTGRLLSSPLSQPTAQSLDQPTRQPGPTNKLQSLGQNPAHKLQSLGHYQTNKLQPLGHYPANKLQSLGQYPTNKLQSSGQYPANKLQSLRRSRVTKLHSSVLQ